MGIDQLKDVYDPLTRKKTTAPGSMSSWKDSAAVVRLSEYLKLNKGCGIQVVNRNGMPALSFHPGLRKANGTSRWQIAVNVEHLFFEASADLDHLITSGLIKIKEITEV
jgi:hypothetical protein